MKNKTGIKSFDRYNDDARIDSIEKNDADIGESKYYIELSDGYRCEGCITINAWSVSDANYQIGMVR